MKIHDKLLITTNIYHQHPDLDIPVKIVKYPVAFDDDYIVHSPISDKTFTVFQGHVRVYKEPEHSEYVVDLPTVNVKSYYKGKTSLYKVAEEWGLNAWESDILKRIIRCRHKGNFVEDLEKTKDLIDIYLKEYGNK